MERRMEVTMSAALAGVRQDVVGSGTLGDASPQRYLAAAQWMASLRLTPKDKQAVLQVLQAAQRIFMEEGLHVLLASVPSDPGRNPKVASNGEVEAAVVATLYRDAGGTLEAIVRAQHARTLAAVLAEPEIGRIGLDDPEHPKKVATYVPRIYYVPRYGKSTMDDLKVAGTKATVFVKVVLGTSDPESTHPEDSDAAGKGNGASEHNHVCTLEVPDEWPVLSGSYPEILWRLLDQKSLLNDALVADACRNVQFPPIVAPGRAAKYAGSVVAHAAALAAGHYVLHASADYGVRGKLKWKNVLRASASDYVSREGISNKHMTAHTKVVVLTFTSETGHNVTPGDVTAALKQYAERTYCRPTLVVLVDAPPLFGRALAVEVANRSAYQMVVSVRRTPPSSKSAVGEVKTLALPDSLVTVLSRPFAEWVMAPLVPPGAADPATPVV